MPFKKIIKILLFTFMLYLILGGVIIYINQKVVSEPNKKTLDSKEYFSKDLGSDKANLIVEPIDSFNVRLSLIKEAKESIDIVYHILEEGDSTNEFLVSLYEAAERGIKIRFLLDSKTGIWSREVQTKIKMINSHENITFYFFNRLNILKPWTVQSYIHDKFLIVDETYVLIGGRNIGDRFFETNNYKEAIVYDYDVLVKNTGEFNNSVIKGIKNYFDLILLNKATKKQEKRKLDKDYLDKMFTLSKEFKLNNPKMYLKEIADYDKELINTNKITLIYNEINNTKKEPWIFYQISSLINKAREKVIIQSPYATNNKKILDLFSKTHDRGINLTYITNSKLSTPNILGYSNYAVNRVKFLNTGINIYEYQNPGSIHGKGILIDSGISIIGSFNLEDRSMYINTESMIIIDSKEFNKRLEEEFNDIINKSLKVCSDNTYNTNDYQEASLKKKIIISIVGHLSRLFRYLI